MPMRIASTINQDENGNLDWEGRESREPGHHSSGKHNSIGA